MYSIIPPHPFEAKVNSFYLLLFRTTNTQLSCIQNVEFLDDVWQISVMAVLLEVEFLQMWMNILMVFVVFV